MKTVLNISTSSAISLARVDPQGPEKDEKPSALADSEEKEEIKDTIDLGIGFDLAENLRNAKDTDDLISLLKEGQDEARANIAKFKALQEERLFGKNEESYGARADHLFEAVRRTVVDILSEQGKEQTGIPKSFEARLSMYLNERQDPSEMDPA